jgi:hypothetical protein
MVSIQFRCTCGILKKRTALLIAHENDGTPFFTQHAQLELLKFT